MADKLTPEAIALKRRGRRRLIGGATIALLMVVFLPMVFDTEPKSDKQEISLVVPPREGLPPLAAPAAVPSAVPSKSESPRESKDNPPIAPAEVAKVSPAPSTQPAKAELQPEIKPALTQPPTVTPKPEPQPATSAKKEGFAVQLGVFTDIDNLKQLKAKMAAAKIPVYTEELKSASGSATGVLTRLRAGPHKTREQAEKTLLRAKKAGADEAKVVPLP